MRMNADNLVVHDDQPVDPVESPLACVHRGSKRRCCNLWICRLHKVDCVPTVQLNQPVEVRSCADCEDMEAIA